MIRDKWRKTKDYADLCKEKYFRNFVFIHINKTAGSSIERAMGVRFGHMTAMEKMHFIGERRWQEKFSFAFVRNPWDRMVSYYHYRVRSNQTGLGDGHLDFSEWIREVFEQCNPVYRDNERMFMPQRDWLVDNRDSIVVSFIGRYENLAHDFALVRDKTNRGAALPHIKSSDRGNYKEYYDDYTRKLVADAHKKDIEEFGYSFG